MPFLRRVVAVCFGCLAVFSRTTSGAPASPALSILPNAGSGGDLTLGLPQQVNGSTLCDIGSLRGNHNGAVSWEKGTWRISDTLKLAIVICNWTPDPTTIQAVLAAAAVTAGKKPALAVLLDKFVQRSNNRYNTLYFEIGPEDEKRLLTWGVVGEVLGENGLGRFFETTGQWHTVYFEVVDAVKGPLGNGAVRRWWQVELPGG